jgi:hypothetical protein
MMQFRTFLTLWQINLQMPVVLFLSAFADKTMINGLLIGQSLSARYGREQLEPGRPLRNCPVGNFRKGTDCRVGFETPKMAKPAFCRLHR